MERSQTSRAAALLVLCLILAGCTPSPKIRAESNPNANFAAYRSFAWAPANTPPPAGERLAGLADWRIRNAVVADLQARGWTQVPERDVPGPDVLVDYGVLVQDKYTDSFSGYAQYVGEGGRQGMGDAFVSGYQQGTLVLHLYDARTRQLVWRASATAVLGAEQNGELAQAAVKDMLAKLPSQ